MDNEARRIDLDRLAESLLFLAIGIALLVYSWGMWTAKMDISMSPNLFPFMVGCFFAALALVLLAQSLGIGMEKTAQSDKPAVNLDWRSVLVVIGFSIVYFLVLPIFHFMPSTMLFLFGLLFFLGEKRIWLDIALSVGMSVAIYVSFGILLNVMLP